MVVVVVAVAVAVAVAAAVVVVVVVVVDPIVWSRFSPGRGLRSVENGLSAKGGGDPYQNPQSELVASIPRCAFQFGRGGVERVRRGSSSDSKEAVGSSSKNTT